jgi:hypothetical protein
MLSTKLTTDFLTTDKRLGTSNVTVWTCLGSSATGVYTSGELDHLWYVRRQSKMGPKSSRELTIGTNIFFSQKKNGFLAASPHWPAINRRDRCVDHLYQTRQARGLIWNCATRRLMNTCLVATLIYPHRIFQSQGSSLDPYDHTPTRLAVFFARGVLVDSIGSPSPRDGSWIRTELQCRNCTCHRPNCSYSYDTEAASPGYAVHLDAPKRGGLMAALLMLLPIVQAFWTEREQY